MSKLIWDEQGAKKFEAGTDHAVLYPISSGAYPKGVAWNGITAVNESPEGGDAQDFYADNIKYGSLRGAENFNGSIECYTYPDEWKECDGRKELVTGVTIAQQNRKAFGLSYRSLIGNDTEGLDLGYTLHLVYNATASPSQKSRSTINESPEAGTMSYEFKTTPVPVTVIENAKATSHIEIDSTLVTEDQLAAIEAILYGTDASDAYIAVSPEASDNPASEGWYEKVEGVYVLSEDTTADLTKTYYEKTTVAATDPRLPLPDEVYQILTSA
ncbi:MAG: hypothetical protein J6U54_23080 [Clostridiales bacterium]|nr:hypothetical protein [Clostridiales bacterium]